MRSDRSEATASDRADAAPLRLDAAACLRIVRVRDKVLFTSSHL